MIRYPFDGVTQWFDCKCGDTKSARDIFNRTAYYDNMTRRRRLFYAQTYVYV